MPYLTNAAAGSVLFIDEIHRLSKSVEEFLYPAMEDYRIDIVLGEGINARTLNMQLQPFHIDRRHHQGRHALGPAARPLRSSASISTFIPSAELARDRPSQRDQTANGTGPRGSTRNRHSQPRHSTAWPITNCVGCEITPPVKPKTAISPWKWPTPHSPCGEDRPLRARRTRSQLLVDDCPPVHRRPRRRGGNCPHDECLYRHAGRRCRAVPAPPRFCNPNAAREKGDRRRLRSPGPQPHRPKAQAR